MVLSLRLRLSSHACVLPVRILNGHGRVYITVRLEAQIES